MEIRIYFECLEQANHYIRPLVDQGIQQSGRIRDVGVKLVLRPKRFRCAVPNAISAIYALTTPDFLITLSLGVKEVPIVVGEFSEAVQTEDHELQRAIGALAAAITGSFYLKIAGNKASMRAHGGNVDFDPLTVASILRQVFNYKGYIAGVWPTDPANPCTLLRNPDFLSCPASGAIPLVEQTLPVIVAEAIDKHAHIVSNKISITDAICPALQNLPLFRALDSDVSAASCLDRMVSAWKSRRSTRIQYGEDLTIKINRFSHAADPERGMLMFASSVLPASRVLTTYEVSRRVSDRDELLEAFLEQAAAEGVSTRFLQALGHEVAGLIPPPDLDLTRFLVEQPDLWSGNKVLFSVFVFSDAMTVFSGGVNLRFVWDRQVACGVSRATLMESLATKLGANNIGVPAELKPHGELTEDEVTYIIVHRVLKPNSFTVISASYPGAQGDAAILPQKGTGRAQRRMYLDVMAWLPSSIHENIALGESKAVFDRTALEQVINRLSAFRTDDTHQEALKDTLERVSGSRRLRRIVIGVAFGTQHGVSTVWRPSEVDFIVRVIGRATWQVASFGNMLRESFRIIEGPAELPTVYEINA